MSYYFLKLITERKYSYYDKTKKRVITPDYRRYWVSVFNYLSYLEKIRKTGMVFDYYDNNLKRQRTTGEYYNRYHSRYIASIYARLKKLELWAKNEFDGFLTLMTLTVYQKGKTIGVCLDELQESKKALVANLRKIRSEIGFLEYIWVIEPHKSGYPHCHFILFTEKEFRSTFEKRLKKLWAKKYGAGSYKWGLHLGSDEEGNKNSQQIEYLAQYLLKYIGKTLGGVYGSFSSPSNVVFHAEVWKKYNPSIATDEKSYQAKVEKKKNGKHKVIKPGRGVYRLWDSSRGLKQVMKPDEKPESSDNYVSVSIKNHTYDEEEKKEDVKQDVLDRRLSRTYDKGNQELFLNVAKRKKREALEELDLL